MASPASSSVPSSASSSSSDWESEEEVMYPNLPQEIEDNAVRLLAVSLPIARSISPERMGPSACMKLVIAKDMGGDGERRLYKVYAPEGPRPRDLESGAAEYKERLANALREGPSKFKVTRRLALAGPQGQDNPVGPGDVVENLWGRNTMCMNSRLWLDAYLKAFSGPDEGQQGHGEGQADHATALLLSLAGLEHVEAEVCEDLWAVSFLATHSGLQDYVLFRRGPRDPITLDDKSFAICQNPDHHFMTSFRRACLRWNGQGRIGDIKHVEPILLNPSLKTLELVSFRWVGLDKDLNTVCPLRWHLVSEGITTLNLSGCLIDGIGLEQVFKTFPNLTDLSIELGCTYRLSEYCNADTGMFLDLPNTLKRDLGVVLRKHGGKLKRLDLDAHNYPVGNTSDLFGDLSGLSSLEHLKISRNDFIRAHHGMGDPKANLNAVMKLPDTLKTLYIRERRAYLPSTQPRTDECVALINAMPNLTSVTVEFKGLFSEPAVPAGLDREIEQVQVHRAALTEREATRKLGPQPRPKTLITLSRRQQ